MLKLIVLAYAGAGIAFAMLATPAPQAERTTDRNASVYALCATVTNKSECEATLLTAVACADAGTAALRRECEEK